MASRLPESLALLTSVAVLAWACGSDSPSSPTGPTPPAGSMALVGGTLVDGTGSPPVPDAALLIRNGRIEAVGPRATVSVPGTAQVVDVSGRFVLPGFINAHVHNAINEVNLSRWAAAGVTTVRDVGAREPVSSVFAMRDRSLREPRLARLLAAGPIVTVPGGYPISGFSFPSLAVESEQDARSEVGRLIDQGADVIKVALEEGPGWPLLSATEVSAVVETAHVRGVPVTAHVTEARFLERAVQAGIDDAAHMVRDPMPPALIARMVRSGIAIVPTLDAAGPQDLRPFLEAGGIVAFGNDGGYLAGIETSMPVRELELMREAGLSRGQVIVAATRNAARVCRRDSLLGTLEAGKAADVLVVDGDPLADLGALRNVHLVLRDGVIIQRGP